MIAEVFFITAFSGIYGGFLGALAFIALCFILGFIFLMFFAAKEARSRKRAAKAP